VRVDLIKKLQGEELPNKEEDNSKLLILKPNRKPANIVVNPATQDFNTSPE
jgi:hypothetical protein